MTLIPVIAAVIRRKGEYLVARRPESKAHGGLWEFPGGKVEAGEDSESALDRELREELSVELQSIGRLLFSASDPNRPFVVHFVEASVVGQPLALEHSEIRWVSPSDLGRLELAPADAHFVKEGLPLGNHVV